MDLRSTPPSPRAFVPRWPRWLAWGLLAATLTLFTTLAFALGGCGDYAGVDTSATTLGGSPIAGADPASSTAVGVIAMPASADATPEEISWIPWGTGPGEVALGEGDFGTGGPDLFAVSPDGRTIAIFDMYANPRRVNLYSDGKPEGSIGLDRAPLGLAVNDNRETYALFQARPTSELVRRAASGEVLETLAIDGTLDPMGPLFWVGSDLYALAGVGGTDADGFLMVAPKGAVGALAGQELGRGAILQEYPVPSGTAALEQDTAGDYLLSLTIKGEASTAARLSLPPGLSTAYGYLAGNALEGLPVIMFHSSGSSGSPSGHFVAVDVVSGTAREATVPFDWKVPGGGAVVGRDAVYVMRGDLSLGLQLLRVAFR